MNREELFTSIVAARPDRDDIVYLQRRGSQYDWRITSSDDDGVVLPALDAAVWMSFSTAWPLSNPKRLQAFFHDLLAELESMGDRSDRCRWPIDDPWPHFH
jgi:hypothetical protein